MAYTKIPAATSRIDELTSSGSWVCPSGVYAVEALLVGGGGGGGGVTTSAATQVSCGGGGGAGAVIRTNLKVTPGTTYTITIGSGGSGGSGANLGAVGGDTKIENGATLLAIAYGGGGGGGVTGGTGAMTSSALIRATTGGRAAYNSTVGVQGGGGGGGNLIDGSYNLVTYAYQFQAFKGNNTGTNSAVTQGLPGLSGFGHGGNGGCYNDTAGIVEATAINGGLGGFLTVSGTSENGTNATANTGGGGGGAAIAGTTTSANGGNGGSGFIRLEYFA